MKQLRPLEGQCLIRIFPAQHYAPDLILLPDHTLSPEERQEQNKHPSPPPAEIGVVESLGRFPVRNGLCFLTEFGVGAKVLIRATCGQEMHRNIGERLKMVPTKDVLAVLQ